MGLSQEKLLLKFKKPILEHVIDAIQGSNCFSKVVCVTSPHAPKTREFVKHLGIPSIDTKGNGYVDDLNEALSTLDERVFVTSGDLPLLDSEIVKKIANIQQNNDSWLCVVASKKFLKSIGVEAEYDVTCNGIECAYAGIYLVNPSSVSRGREVNESYIIIDDKRIALNLNKKEDYELLCGS